MAKLMLVAVLLIAAVAAIAAAPAEVCVETLPRLLIKRRGSVSTPSCNMYDNLSNSPVFEPLELSEGVEGFVGQEFEEPDEHLRFRRVTCDLLSFKGVVGDSACAANCLSMGKAGGTCHGGICQCRKTKIKDLWNKRFG